MTYCAGWKYKDSVYLLADTAATKSVPPAHPRSSFGELHAQVRRAHVEESLLKLVPIADGVAFAFAGDVHLATAIGDHLRNSYDTATSTADLFAGLTASVGPFDPSTGVEVLLARSTLTQTSIDMWNTRDGLDTSGSDYFQIGSLTSFHASLTPSVLAVLTRGNLPPDRLLEVIASVVQSYGINDNLIDQNVGGLIFGLRTSGGVVNWQSDTNYMVYDSSMSNTNFVSAFARDNVLVLSSSLNDDVRILAHSTSTPSLDRWMKRWEEPLLAHLRSDQFRYWVFLKVVDRVITIVRRESLDMSSHLLSLTEEAPGKFDIGLSPRLMQVLHLGLNDRQDGSVPFRLNFLNG